MSSESPTEFRDSRKAEPAVITSDPDGWPNAIRVCGDSAYSTVSTASSPDRTNTPGRTPGNAVTRTRFNPNAAPDHLDDDRDPAHPGAAVRR